MDDNLRRKFKANDETIQAFQELQKRYDALKKALLKLEQGYMTGRHAALSQILRP